MPVKIPVDLPAAQILYDENIFVMPIDRAVHQDIRPLRILFLNLMPTKIVTETQFARVLGNTPLQIELDLMSVSSHIPANVSQEHMLAFYQNFDAVKDDFFGFRLDLPVLLFALPPSCLPWTLIHTFNRPL